MTQDRGTHAARQPRRCPQVHAEDGREGGVDRVEVEPAENQCGETDREPGREATREPALHESAELTPEQGRDALNEEIAKILSETDVYIKYNLHAKAIEHLQRVFERAPRHTGAREKLKALYITTGRRDEAVLELWALAEHAEPGRARRYVREIYELDPSNARAAQILGEPIRSAAQVAPHEPEDDFGVAPPDEFGLPSIGGAREEPATRRARAGAPGCKPGPARTSNRGSPRAASRPRPART